LLHDPPLPNAQNTEAPAEEEQRRGRGRNLKQRQQPDAKDARHNQSDFRSGRQEILHAIGVESASAL